MTCMKQEKSEKSLFIKAGTGKYKGKQNVLDLRNAAQVACFPIDSVPGMTSQRDYAQVSLCVVFDMTRSNISRF